MKLILPEALELGPGRWKAPRTGSLERLPYTPGGGRYLAKDQRGQERARLALQLPSGVRA